MITVLERQHVSKRAAPPVHLRARTNGVRWSSREPAALPRGAASLPLLRSQSPRKVRPARWRRHVGHAFLQRQTVSTKRRRAARKAERAALRNGPPEQARPRRPRRPRPAAAHRAPGKIRDLLANAAGSGRGALRSPWLFIGLAVAAAATIIVSVVGIIGIPLAPARPALPVPTDVDQALYGLLVPEPAPKQAIGVNPVLLSSLKVARYRIKAGDSLSKIAERFKLNIDSVVSWNGITDARAIPVGTMLDIPNSNGLKYTVRRGDTLQGIARSWGVDFNSLLDWNRLPSSLISVGQQLFLPGARMNPTDLNRILGSLFVFPVQGRISSYFGERSNPFTGVASNHNGIDIVNKAGTPILSAMGGTVSLAGWNANYGYFVILKHAGNYQTLYGHLARYQVKQGQKVSQGQQIGELGSTGYSTGPHLHFTIFRNYAPVDPLKFLN